MKANYFDWNERVVANLRALWAEGMPVRQIGVELGCNASQVIGKAHRLDLPRRQNPVKRVYEKGATRKAAKAPKPPKRMPQLVAAPLVKYLEMPDMTDAPVHWRARFGKDERLPVPNSTSPHRTCQWPISGGRPWVFCGCAAVPGFSWCAEHKARVFERRAA